ncbi:MAG: SWIM zinc finger family protein [Deltaproteobacteria bacterium]
MTPPDDDRRARWELWREYRAAPKKPPPAHGIKMKKAGTTWWGQRWIEALEHVLQGDAARLGRGRTYARAGRAHDLAVQAGKVVSQVTGSRPAPYAVTIELRVLSDADWEKAILGMAERAQFSAELLAGEMPKAIDEVFRAAGTSLFPEQRADLQTSCSCPDWGNPCKHVAATHYVLGEALDRDPFLLFELRGRSKAQVLDSLRRARTSAALEVAPVLPARTTITAADYDRPPASLPALDFSFAAPTTHAALLRQLGVPSAWSEALSPADALAPLVQQAGEAARRLALSEAEPASTAEAPRPAEAPRTAAVPRRRKKAPQRPAQQARSTKAQARASRPRKTKRG